MRKGDRVCIYMPMIPELAYTMLACARIGAIHSIVFGGFSSEAIRDRILDAGCKIVITANEGLRGGKRLKLKQTVDRAIDGLDLVKTVLVARRTDADTEMRAGPRLLAGRGVPQAALHLVGGVDGRRGSRCSSSTPAVRRASPRASCTPPAATWSTPR